LQEWTIDLITVCALLLRVFSRTIASTGKSRLIRIAIIAITVMSSMRVKATIGGVWEGGFHGRDGA
jgi:hypothetical protein